MQGSGTTVSSDAFVAMIEAAGLTGHWSWCFATRAHVWSAGFFQILGLAPGAIEPSWEILRDRVHPEDRPGLPACDAALAEILCDHTFRVLRWSGCERTLKSRGELVRDLDGAVIGVAGVVFDITEQDSLWRSREAELRRNRALFDHASIVFSSMDSFPPDDYPPELRALTGLRNLDLLKDFARFVLPEQRAYRRERLAQLVRQGQPFSMTPTLALANGHGKAFTAVMVPVEDSTGRVEGWASLMVPAGPERTPPDTARDVDPRIAAPHLRAARNLLGWSMMHLAKASGLTSAVIRRLEAPDAPSDPDACAEAARGAVILALRSAGITFALIEGGAIAVARLD
jgi:PAS domain-containing protein